MSKCYDSRTDIWRSATCSAFSRPKKVISSGKNSTQQGNILSGTFGLAILAVALMVVVAVIVLKVVRKSSKTWSDLHKCTK